jgi:hypothetical protein
MIDDSDVSTWPEWVDCPFRDRMPSGVKVLRHRPRDLSVDIVSFWRQVTGKHVDIGWTTADDRVQFPFECIAKPALTELGAV